MTTAAQPADVRLTVAAPDDETGTKSSHSTAILQLSLPAAPAGRPAAATTAMHNRGANNNNNNTNNHDSISVQRWPGAESNSSEEGSFDSDTLEAGFKALNRRSLRFKSPVLEHEYWTATINKYRQPLITRSITALMYSLVFVVPIIQLAAAAPTVPVATVVCLAFALLGGLLAVSLIFFCSRPFLIAHWNWFAFSTSFGVVAGMFIILTACVRDGLAPDMESCTPDYGGIAPLFPLMFAHISPFLAVPLNRASWYTASVLAVAMDVMAVTCLAVAGERNSIVVIMAVSLTLNILTASSVAYIAERSERALMWLSLQNKKGADVLARSEVARADQTMRNRTFQSFADASGQVLYELNPANRFTSVSKAALQLFGRDPSSMRNLLHSHFVHPEDVQRVETAVAALWGAQPQASGGAPLVLQFRRLLPAGESVWVEMLAVLEVDQSGPLIVATERDITRERAEREVQTQERERQAAATVAQIAREETLGYACHELRNPLHVINAACAVLNDTPVAQDPELGQHLAAIRISARQMRTLVDDILDVERLRAGKLPLRPAPFAPGTLVKDASLQHGDFARVPIDWHVGPDVPDRVHAPGDRIQQVLNNGLTNAAKFCDVGIIRIRVLNGSEPNTLRFEVRNPGTVPTRPLFRSFGFTQEAKMESETIKGSGLGLRICSLLVAAMNGTMNLEDLPVVERLEGGADTEVCFWFQIPYEPVLASSPAKSHPLGSDVGPLQLRVLVVDDEVLNRRMAEHMLKSIGCTSVLLSDGDQVMDANPGSFDVVLLDIVMQRMRGDEVVRLIRAAGLRVPCIAVTGNTDAVSAAAYIEAGFDDVMGKPFTTADIKQRLQAIVLQSAAQ